MAALWNDPAVAWNSPAAWWNGGGDVPPPAFTPRLPLKAVVVEARAVAVVDDGAVVVAVGDTASTASLVGPGPATVVVAP